ncbi:cohesin domain-containing protein [Stieleria neptunia]|nr:cohesin domain-containing protein [Stieleria neptunia]
MAVQTRRLAAERLESRRLLATVSVEQSFDESARELRLPLRVENAQDVRAAEIRIEYDPNVVRAEEWKVEPGEFWNGRVSLSVNIDQDAGTITAFLFTAEPVAATAGDLIRIDFQEEACVSQPGAAPITVSHVHFDERAAALSVTAPMDRQPVLQPFSQLADSSSRRIDHSGDLPMGPLRPDRVDALMASWLPSERDPDETVRNFGTISDGN